MSLLFELDTPIQTFNALNYLHIGGDPRIQVADPRTGQNAGGINFPGVTDPSFTFPQPFTISASVDSANGNVNCAPNTVPQGDSASCTAVPDTGYQVQSWTGACATTGHTVQCALSHVQADQTSTVRFEPIPPASYTISATVASGLGSVSCAPTTVPKGAASTCTATPNAGYQVQAWGGDCNRFGNSPQCYLPKIQKNQTSTVSFATRTLATVRVSATVVGGNGAVSCTPTRVAAGGSSTCTALRSSGFQIGGWSGVGHYPPSQPSPTRGEGAKTQELNSPPSLGGGLLGRNQRVDGVWAGS